jgi:pimeloyl-ACP methyl ester carboxylesterase
LILDLQVREAGAVVRDGITVAYQTFGHGSRTVLLMPDWAIAHSVAWRSQVAHLAVDHLVVTFDGRGNGASDRPADPAAYAPAIVAGDALAVLDAVGAERVAILAAGGGTGPTGVLAASHPERVGATVLIGSTLPLATDSAERESALVGSDRRLDHDPRGVRWNPQAWQRDWWGFLEAYAAACFPEPDSEAFIRQRVEMGLETTPEVAAASADGGRLDPAEARDLMSSIRGPVLVIHGAADAIAPVEIAVRLAALARAGLHILPGAGHHPEARHAAQTNALIDVFLNGNPYGKAER